MTSDEEEGLAPAQDGVHTTAIIVPEPCCKVSSALFSRSEFGSTACEIPNWSLVRSLKGAIFWTYKYDQDKFEYT